MVFQRYALFPHMSVAENVAFPLRMRKVAKAEQARRVARALELVRLADYGKRRVTQLSGGQQQRVALARAVVFDPPVLLMDEPLGALDKRLREEMQIELKHIQRQLRTTVIYVTHDQAEALTMADRIAVLQRWSAPAVRTARSRSTSGPSMPSWPASSVRPTSSTASSSRKPGRAGAVAGRGRPRDPPGRPV